MFSFYNAQNSRWYHVFCWSVSSHSRELARKPLDEKWQLNIIDKHIHIQISANEQPSTVEMQRCSAPQLRPARAIWLSPLHAQTLTQRKRIPIGRLPSFQHRLKPAPAGRRCHQQGSAPTRCPNTDSSANKLTPITSRSRRSHLLAYASASAPHGPVLRFRPHRPPPVDSWHGSIPQRPGATPFAPTPGATRDLGGGDGGV
jgi:hypothetical protein